jgi:hypothetical protein
MCPNPDPDVKVIRRAVYKSIGAVEKQIKLLAQRLLRSQQRLNDLQAKQQKPKEKL